MRIHPHGKLIAITGPMFSGKTSRLIELLERERYAGNKIELFKPLIDDRYSKTEAVTHKGEKLPAVTVTTDMLGVEEIRRAAKNVDVLGVDEAQFWGQDSLLPKALDELASLNKIVYVSILNKDHTGEPFNNTLDILSRADIIYSLTAICKKCGEEATFTQRVRDGKEIFGPQVQVGGVESYEPRCRRCFVWPPAAMSHSMMHQKADVYSGERATEQ